MIRRGARAGVLKDLLAMELLVLQRTVVREELATLVPVAVVVEQT